ncbi:hypothetical protein ALI22I_44240 [Saccharothrix sp. ALI-22-I]|uniref:hypothetical protein n=1 Tax=Saccharothrix sp. ALI-22-I TaxID=1933778 RepID=UPI0009D3F07B|nr:hypothetical protein [Saccharothrix sp. ALI-22-I]ONI80355.1 hypothetical protein ALI22I_44240 [Saccharothrix sp. ALI-22-I]
MWENERELNERELGGVLRSEVDGPAPAVRTDLADVLRRGRRRLLVRRAGAAAGVLAVVGVVGFGTAALSSLAGPDHSSSAGGDGPLVTMSPATVGPEWTAVNQPPRIPYGTFTPAWTAPPPEGREILAIPQCDSGTGSRFTTWNSPRPPMPVLNAWGLAVAQVASPARVSELNTRTIPANKDKHPDSVDGHVQWIDVTDEHGTGSVDLKAGYTTLDPVAAADDEAFVEGNCAPPRRLVRPDGTVLQFYPVRVSEPFQSLARVLRVYTPTGETYAITVVNYGSPDFEFRERDASFNRTGAGRETLPLTEEQLTRIALAVADAT